MLARTITQRLFFCTQNVRPFEEIPRAKQRPLFGSALEIVKKYGSTEGHRMAADRVKEFGKIYYEKMFNFVIVHIADPALTAALFRNEGKYPRRVKIPVWLDIRRKRGIPLSVLLAEEEVWYRMRRAIDKQLLSLPNIYKYIQPMNGIAEDFIKLFLKGDEKCLQELAFRWSLESVCTFLYDTRIGCLSDNPPANALLFGEAVSQIFNTSNKLLVFPPKLAQFLLPFTYRKLEKSWNTVFDVGKIYMDNKLKDLKAKLDDGKEADGFLSSLITNEKINQQEAFSITVELMAAGVDTTANTFLWFIHLLSENVDIQERLFEEIRAAGVSNGARITEEYIRNAPYLKACFKETTRMRPILVGTSRIVPEDTVLNNYRIPKGTTVIPLNMTMSNSEEYFPNPNMFSPERWLEKSANVVDKSNVKNFTALPFGFGPRSCVGRRLAELEIYILITKLVGQYKIVSLNGGLVEQCTQLIVTPKTPIKIKLEKRQF